MEGGRLVQRLRVMNSNFVKEHLDKFVRDTNTCPFCGRTSLGIEDVCDILDDGEPVPGMISIVYNCLSCGNKLLADFQLTGVCQIQQSEGGEDDDTNIHE